MLPIAFFLSALLLPLSAEARMKQAERDDALRFHTHLRKNVLPPAADMNALQWSSKLERLAQRAADSCKFAHNYEGEYAKLGENLYYGSRRNFTEILMFMFLEREVYDYKRAKCVPGPSTKYPFFTTCGHYLQIATAAIVELGCGVKKCPDNNHLAVCEYNVYQTNPPYSAGEAGTKCGRGGPSYHYDGLCYSRAAYMPQAPNPAALECKLKCLNNGRLKDAFGCFCVCPKGFYGRRCEASRVATLQRKQLMQSQSASCHAQAMDCKNGGVPKIIRMKCKCMCRPGFRGKLCEENIKFTDNSVYWYFGQQMRYKSYYPVDKKIFSTLYVSDSLLYYLTNAINAFCKTNYKTCCPEAASNRTSRDIVSYMSYSVTEGYPKQVLDGSLKAGIHYRMLPAHATLCNRGISPLVNKQTLLRAAARAKKQVTDILRYVHVSVIKFH